MFDWFGRKDDYSNVVKFPDKVSPTPYIAPPTPKEVQPDAVYSIGVTAEGTHMTFTMGYSTLTMTKTGCQNLIDQLEVFKNQLGEDE